MVIVSLATVTEADLERQGFTAALAVYILPSLETINDLAFLLRFFFMLSISFFHSQAFGFGFFSSQPGLLCFEQTISGPCYSTLQHNFLIRSWALCL